MEEEKEWERLTETDRDICKRRGRAKDRDSETEWMRRRERERGTEREGDRERGPERERERRTEREGERDGWKGYFIILHEHFKYVVTRTCITIPIIFLFS